MFVFTTIVTAACSTPSSQPFERSFDPCLPLRIDAPVVTDAQRAGLASASALWHAAGIPGPGDTGDVAITVTFQASTPAFYGLFDGATDTIFINDALGVDELPIVVAHELGHAFGLVHVPLEQRSSVMNAGNLTVTPTSDDRAAVEAIWGPCVATHE